MRTAMFLLLGVLVLGHTPHPMHVSVLEAHYRPGGKLEVTLRIFVDDLELALRRQYGEPSSPLRLGTPQQSPQAEEWMQRYVLTHIALQPDGKAAQLRYIGYEYEQDAVYVYLEAEQVPDFAQLQVVNKVLLTVYDDQSNICNISHRGRTLSVRTSHGAESGYLVW